VDLNWLGTALPTNAQEIGMDADDAFQSVNEIVTDVLLIPKVYKYDTEDGKFIELETDFPDLTEEERTHDGIWVKAYGGLVAT
jgi:hypothetical protein